MAESADAVGDVTLSGGVTIGAVRAAADRCALRRRYHDPSVAGHYRPADEGAAALFDALEQARLDAIGSRWLRGVGENLLAFPGREDDGVRWLAFECLANRDAPSDVAPAVARARADLGREAVEALMLLASSTTDHPGFAERAAAWCQQVHPHVAPLADVAREPRFRIPDRPRGAPDVRRGRYALPGADARPRNEEASEDASSALNQGRSQDDPVAALIGYRAYTRAFDRVVQASALAGREELAALRVKLDADFGPLRSTVARLAKRLMRVLMARQAREWRFDLDDGFLDPSRLSVFVASDGAARPFKQEFESPFPGTVVSLLIDHSGSMRGRPMQIAALTVEIFARVLERCGVRCEVLGFTTAEWDGGEPGRQWAASGYPPDPGRLNALEHIVIKGADVPWRRARMGLGLFLHDELLKENIDGEALAWAHARLLARPERRRILVVVSDGEPMDEATCAANGFDYLDGHLAAVVEDIERRSPVQLAAIGIGHDVSRFYRNATRISRIDDLGPALTTKLLSLLAE